VIRDVSGVSGDRVCVVIRWVWSWREGSTAGLVDGGNLLAGGWSLGELWCINS